MSTKVELAGTSTQDSRAPEAPNTTLSKVGIPPSESRAPSVTNVTNQSKERAALNSEEIEHLLRSIVLDTMSDTRFWSSTSCDKVSNSLVQNIVYDFIREGT